MSELYVRLRALKKGPVDYSVHGILFVAGMWAVAAEEIKLESGKTFRLGDYLRDLEHTDGQALFIVTDKAGAEKMERGELQKAERELNARRMASASTPQVASAQRVTDGMEVTEVDDLRKAAPVAVVVDEELKSEPDEGAEKIGKDELDEADEIAEAASAKSVQNDDDVVKADESSNSRRAARAARNAATKKTEPPVK
jgi:hypothetical protein